MKDFHSINEVTNLKEKCGKCIYRTKIEKEWTCGCEESEYYSLEVPYEFVCDDYKGSDKE